MARVLKVEGFDAFKKVVDENKSKSIFALFTGSVGANGKSWCPDCVTGMSKGANSCTFIVTITRPLLALS